MDTTFLFQVEEMIDYKMIFNKLEHHKILFSYFQVDQSYYLFCSSEKAIDINFVSKNLKVIEELDSKKRKIRSVGGFLLHALTIVGSGNKAKIHMTNLQPFFWRKLTNVIRQNKKGVLHEFLVALQLNPLNNRFESKNNLEERVRNLTNRLTILEKRLLNLETTFKKKIRM
jgi:hypothetical protein